MIKVFCHITKMLRNLLKLFWSSKPCADGTKRVRFLFFRWRHIPWGYRNRMLETKVSLMEQNLIESSYLWDAEWYVKTYGYSFSRPEALEYWCKQGWKKGENPSPYLNMRCFPSSIGINPILAALTGNGNNVFYLNNHNAFASEADEEIIRLYHDQRKKRKASSVVYCCITGGYDDIANLSCYKHTNPDWDYVCYTDDEKQLERGYTGIWQMRPLKFSKLDNTRNSRWHKTHPHILFPEYEESIFVDPHINLLTNHLFDTIRQIGKQLAAPAHFKNMCVYAEAKDILKFQVDKADVVTNQVEFLIDEGMPSNYGLCETGLLYRCHHNDEIVAIDEEWWEMIATRSLRDQLSFTYVLWKHGIQVKDICFRSPRFLVNDYYYYSHKLN